MKAGRYKISIQEVKPRDLARLARRGIVLKQMGIPALVTGLYLSAFEFDNLSALDRETPEALIARIRRDKRIPRKRNGNFPDFYMVGEFYDSRRTITISRPIFSPSTSRTDLYPIVFYRKVSARKR